jgi:Nucleotidyl transferase AbiEii toxin, Type IV TA system
VRYATAPAFSAALEQRIQRVHVESGLSHARLRKLIVFDRLLARLLAVAPQGWVLKGGVALNLRWERNARTTLDLDLETQADEEEATQYLLAAAARDLGDFFVFAVARTSKLDALRDAAAIRYHVIAELAGRRFDDVTVDIGVGEPLILDPENLAGTEILEFAGIARLSIPTIALEEHIAEKVHAYGRTYQRGGSTRVKDLLDLVLVARNDGPHAGRLRQALAGVFAARNTHPLPVKFPPPPNDWTVPYRRLATEVGLALDARIFDLPTSYEQVAQLLDPILDGTAPDDAQWDPSAHRWHSTEAWN